MSNQVPGTPEGAWHLYWVDPQEEWIGLLLPQVRFLMAPAQGVFQNLAYQAPVD